VPTTILRVGLTGNIASGKSTVAGYLAELGCRVLDLDAIGHQCLLSGEPTQREVVGVFGEAILLADGSVDRRTLGGLVFGDAKARRRLEAILHPAIREREQQRVDEIAASSGSGIVVSEAALLYETGADERYDRMVVVTAPDDVRQRRLEERGLGRMEAEQRMASQMDQYRKAELADYVLDNGGVVEELQEVTRRLGGLLHGDFGKRVGGEPLGPAAGLG
jgi:dephospho-CoA kinase